MKILLVLISIILLTNNILSQDYFPLQIGNRWDYVHHSYAGDSYFKKIVIGDTTLPDGFHYYIIKSIFNTTYFDITYVRVDSHWIYYYPNPVFLLDTLDTTYTTPAWDWEVTSTCCFYTEKFGQPVNIRFYQTGMPGLYEASYIFCDKFGEVYSSYDSHGLPEESFSLIGCIIGDSTYGQLIPVRENNYIQKKLILFHNYPNPFNHSTTIKFELPSSSPVKLKIINILGQTVKIIIDSYLPPGLHSATWSGLDENNRTVSSGLYFYVLEAGNQRKIRKLVLLK